MSNTLRNAIATSSRWTLTRAAGASVARQRVVVTRAARGGSQRHQGDGDLSPDLGLGWGPGWTTHVHAASYRTKGSKNSRPRSDKRSGTGEDAVHNGSDAQRKAKRGTRARVEARDPEKSRLKQRQDDGQLQLLRGGDTAPEPSADFSADPSTPFAHLPDPEQWYEALRQGRGYLGSHRRILSNEDTIRDIIKQLDLPGRRSRLAHPNGRLTVIEGYAGTGTFTRSLLESDDVERVVAMEDNKSFFPWLGSLLGDETLQGKGSKLIAMPASTYHWESYSDMTERGLLDNIASVREARGSLPDYSDGVFASDDWKGESPILFFITLPISVHAEQLMVQLITAIFNRLWLFRYARIPLYLVCSEQIAQRCIAEPGSRFRSRISAIVQAVAEPKLLLDSSHFSAHEGNFWPEEVTVGPRLPRTRHAGSLANGHVSTGDTKQDQCLLVLEPRQMPLVTGPDADAFEYITRHMFVLRAKSVQYALQHMTPGADKLLEVMKQGTHPAMRETGPMYIEPTARVDELTGPQLVALAKIFERWPFRPAQLFEEGRLVEIETQHGRRSV